MRMLGFVPTVGQADGLTDRRNGVAVQSTTTYAWSYKIFSQLTGDMDSSTTTVTGNPPADPVRAIQSYRLRTTIYDRINAIKAWWQS